MTSENDQKVYRSRGRMMLDNFLGGMMWSFGTLIGAVLIISIASLFLRQIDFVPIVGTWLREVVQEALSTPTQSGAKNIRSIPSQ